MLLFVCSGVEEPELILSLNQSTIKQEKEDECDAEETQGPEAVTRLNEERREEETELHTDADLTLDFTQPGVCSTGAHLRRNFMNVV